MADILLLHGPNLNLLGKREPEIYGSAQLADINTAASKRAEQSGLTLESFQSNAEHELITKIHSAADSGVKAIVINPAAWTHTSVALRDALLAIDIPFFEIHISNIHAREEFRQFSYLADIAQGVITGLGVSGYDYAVQAAIQLIQRS